MEFPKVQQAAHQPGGCYFCGNHAGPFLDLQIEQIVVQTPEGDRAISNARVYMCIGDEERPGCACLIVTAIGGQLPWLHEQHQEQQRLAAESAAEQVTAANRLVTDVRELLEARVDESGRAALPSDGAATIRA